MRCGTTKAARAADTRSIVCPAKVQTTSETMRTLSKTIQNHEQNYSECYIQYLPLDCLQGGMRCRTTRAASAPDTRSIVCPARVRSRIWAGFQVDGLESIVQSSGFRVQGSGFRVQVSRSKNQSTPSSKKLKGIWLFSALRQSPSMAGTRCPHFRPCTIAQKGKRDLGMALSKAPSTAPRWQRA